MIQFGLRLNFIYSDPVQVVPVRCRWMFHSAGTFLGSETKPGLANNDNMIHGSNSLVYRSDSSAAQPDVL